MLVSWVLALAGCGWSLPERQPCAEPHLFYSATDPSAVYFGCQPPPGWLETPPDEASYGAAPRPTPKPGLAVRPSDEEIDEAAAMAGHRDTASVVYAGTGVTGDTAVPADAEPIVRSGRGDLGGDRDARRDTGGPYEAVGDTGRSAHDTGARDTGREGGGAPRGRHRTRDTGGGREGDWNRDTGSAPAAQDTGGAQQQAGADTGSR